MSENVREKFVVNTDKLIDQLTELVRVTGEGGLLRNDMSAHEQLELALAVGMLLYGIIYHLKTGDDSFPTLAETLHGARAAIGGIDPSFLECSAIATVDLTAAEGKQPS
jgi:hypothetical protein